jgi:hypothetical protein
MACLFYKKEIFVVDAWEYESFNVLATVFSEY